MTKTLQILLCDDQPAIHETLGVYLQAEGIAYTSVYDGDQALDKALSANYDLIVLDLMMPKMSGLEVCKAIRKTSNVPIIMLTAKGEEIDRIIGLEIGADDYILKPFSPREVVTRIKTVLRRLTNEPMTTNQTITYDNLSISLDRYELSVNGELINTTPKELEIMYYLASHPGRVFDREQLLSAIWGYEYYGDSRAVDTQIKRLRKKLPTTGVNWEIKSIYGVGYKFEVIK
jgi:DNA-binding response OmpR family regulator